MAVVVRDVFFDGANQVRQAAEGAPADPLSRDVREPALNEVEPRGAGRHKVTMVPRMRGKPLLNLGMRMGPVVVENEMNLAPLRDRAIEVQQKREKFRVPFL